MVLMENQLKLSRKVSGVLKITFLAKKNTETSRPKTLITFHF